MSFRNLSFKNAPLIKTPPPGPESKKYLDFQNQHEGGSVSYPKGLPMAINRAKGATIEDVDENIYIDFFGGAGVMAVGHSNPGVVEKVKDQLDFFTHSLDIPNPSRRKLIEKLVSILPKGLNKVFFGGPTGSDAVETAIKLAKLNTGRFSLISFEGGYHGMTSGALSVTSDNSHKNGLLPLLPNVHFAPYAYCYRCAFSQTQDSCSLECAQYLERMVEDPHSGVELPAAIILEPIQGEGGTIVPPKGFLEKIREICNRNGILMIMDEVQTGFCRTGKMFAYEHYDILPDIVVLSKALGGIGLPISCIAYKSELDQWTPGKHIGTFRGNVLAYAAGAAGIEFMLNEKLDIHSGKIGDAMIQRLKTFEQGSEIIGEVRGKGLILGVEIVTNKATKQPAADYAKKIRTHCHQKGLLVEIGGHFSNVVRFLPPLIITEELAQKGLDIFCDAVTLVQKTT